jgi:hypothetical protein
MRHVRYVISVTIALKERYPSNPLGLKVLVIYEFLLERVCLSLTWRV